MPLMSLGASGTISVWADVQPQLVHDMCRAYLDGDVERARDIQIAGQPLINALFSEVNPIPVKEALAQMGMIEQTTACRCAPWQTTRAPHLPML